MIVQCVHPIPKLIQIEIQLNTTESLNDNGG